MSIKARSPSNFDFYIDLNVTFKSMEGYNNIHNNFYLAYKVSQLSTLDLM